MAVDALFSGVYRIISARIIFGIVVWVESLRDFDVWAHAMRPYRCVLRGGAVLRDQLWSFVSAFREFYAPLQRPRACNAPLQGDHA
jgi:hypothetical protein